MPGGGDGGGGEGADLAVSPYFRLPILLPADVTGRCRRRRVNVSNQDHIETKPGTQ